MLARPKLVDGTSARNYYENDTYYINNEFEQGALCGKIFEHDINRELDSTLHSHYLYVNAKREWKHNKQQGES